MIFRKRIVPREGEFVLVMVFEVNYSQLDLFSEFLGHTGRVQRSLIGRELLVISKFQSGATRREQRTKMQII